MPQYVQTPAPEQDVHKGTYQVGTAPKTLGQKAAERRQANRASSMATGKQKMISFNDPAARAEIQRKKAAGEPLSFSDQ